MFSLLHYLESYTLKKRLFHFIELYITTANFDFVSIWNNQYLKIKLGQILMSLRYILFFENLVAA